MRFARVASHAFQRRYRTAFPEVADRVGQLDDWDKIKLLTVQVNRLKRWYRPGLLCIGDAAHAMSPVGGVGINLAVQDAVAASNILADRVDGASGHRSAISPRCRSGANFPMRMTPGFPGPRAEPRAGADAGRRARQAAAA